MLFGLKLRFKLSQTSLQLLFLAKQIDFVVMPKSKSFSWTSGGLCFVSSCSFLENSVASRIFIAIMVNVEYSVLSWDGYKAPQHPVLSLNFSLSFLLGVWNTQFFLCFPWKAIPSIKSFSCSLLGLFIIGFDLGPRFSK